MATLSDTEFIAEAPVLKANGEPVSQRTFQRWCQQGDVPGAHKVRRQWRVPVESLEQFRPPRVAQPTEITRLTSNLRELRLSGRLRRPATDSEREALRQLEQQIGGLRAEVVQVHDLLVRGLREMTRPPR